MFCGKGRGVLGLCRGVPAGGEVGRGLDGDPQSSGSPAEPRDPRLREGCVLRHRRLGVPWPRTVRPHRVASARGPRLAAMVPLRVCAPLLSELAHDHCEGTVPCSICALAGWTSLRGRCEGAALRRLGGR